VLVNTLMLLVSCLPISLVTLFHSMTGDTSLERKHTLEISRICSILVAFSYIAYLVFQLVTHKTLNEDDEDGDDDDDGDGQTSMSFCGAMSFLGAVAVVISICSEMLTQSLEGTVNGSGISATFIGIVLLPIIGNACEHASAITFALQERTNISVGIAIGSSVQIALFVVPLSVLLGWMIGDDKHGHNMDLNFGPLNVTVLTLSVLVVLAIVVDGKSNWLEGYMLFTAYTIVAVLYWFI